MMKFIAALQIFTTLYTSNAFAGFPPTTSKVTGDSSDLTTFKYRFPNFTGTHTGTSISLGVNSSVGGGTGVDSSGSTGIAYLNSGAWSFSASDMSAGSHKITSLTDPTLAQDAATKNYVDTQLAQLNPAAAVVAASTASISGTYINAVSGVCIGDTFTTTSTATFTVDGQTPALTNRVLFKDQTSSFQDGVWTLTTLAVPAVSGAVFTRALDMDSSVDFNAGQIVPITNGTVNAGASYYQTASNTTCNTSTQTWTQFQKASSAYLQAANNLSDVASKSTSFNNLSPMTTGGDLIYGGASGAGTRLANGSSGNVLTSSGGTSAPTWAAPTGGIPTLIGASYHVSAATTAYTGIINFDTSDFDTGSLVTTGASWHFTVPSNGYYVVQFCGGSASSTGFTPILYKNGSAFRQFGYINDNVPITENCGSTIVSSSATDTFDIRGTGSLTGGSGPQRTYVVIYKQGV